MTLHPDQTVGSNLLYFAYGSNMSYWRLRARVSSARPLGRACLAAHRLAFHKIGRDGSGKCDIVPDAAGLVHGVLFEIAAEQKATLNAFEDLGRGYAEVRVTVTFNDERKLQAFAYRALQCDTSLRPYDWYLCHLIEGAVEHRLPRAYRDRLATTTTIVDPDPQRAARELSVYSPART